MLEGAVGGVIGFVLVALLGLVVGVAAKLLMPGADPGGWLWTIVLGIAGSWVGGLLVPMVGLSGTIPALIGAVVGAMLLLAGYRLLEKNG